MSIIKYCVIGLLFLSSAAFACSMGFSFSFIKGVPEGYVYNDDADANRTDFLDKRYGKGKWIYADESYFVKAPKIAEDCSVVQLTIGTDDAQQSGRYKSIELYLQRYINVLVNEKFDPSYLPQKYYILEENQDKNSPNAFDFGKIIRKKSGFFSLVQYQLSNHTLPYTALRVKEEDAELIRLIAVFRPYNTKDKILVLVQKEPTILSSHCHSKYYVEGEWPAGLRERYDYY